MTWLGLEQASALEAGALWATMGISVLALLYAALLARQILAAPLGNAAMQAVGRSIALGANAYLKQQFKVISLFLVVLAAALFASTRSEGHFDLHLAMARTLAFLGGALFSSLVGFLGMNMAVRGSQRVAQAASQSYAEALKLGYRTGTVTGMLTDGLGLLGGTFIFLLYGLKSYEVLLGFGFGACLIALFMRVGGGIYTKAADVGADIVGKLEKGIPEDDPRNAAVVADLVGDNVGDCAGMAADIFESYEVTIVAAMILGGAAFGLPGVLFPVLVRALGVFSSIVGTYAVHSNRDDEDALKSITFGFYVSTAITTLGFTALGWYYFRPGGVPDMRPAWAVFIGIALAIVIHKLTEHATSPEKKPVNEVVESTSTGHATTILSGLALGMESSVYNALAIVAAVLASALLFAGGGMLEVGYGVALCGVGMLTLTGNNLSMDVFGPVVDNANGIGEMGGAPAKAREVLSRLDSVGNTTKAITKGVAIASAVVAAVSLFSSFSEEAARAMGWMTAQGQPDVSKVAMSLNQPVVFLGALLGACMPFLFSAHLLRAVFRSASAIIVEVRWQFRNVPGLMAGKALPDYNKVIRICTETAEKELEMPALLAVLTPVLAGLLLGVEAMGAFLAGAILCGQLLAVMMTNAGGAWDNAKKMVEAGRMGGKGSDAHKAAITGDTVGDPLKDTAGPALNPLIKVMNLVGLLAVPLVVAMEKGAAQGAGWRYTASAALIFLVGFVSWRSRRAARIRLDGGDPPAVGLRANGARKRPRLNGAAKLVRAARPHTAAA